MKRVERTLETPRLRLRPFEPADIPALLEIHRDPEVNRFLPWFPLTTLEEAEAFYRERYAGKDGQAESCDYAICLKEQDVPVGYVGLEASEARDFGYGLRRDCWGRGIVPEAARAVLDWARGEGVPFVTATHDVNNPRSGAVMRRLGMRYAYSYEEMWMPKGFLVTFRMYQLNLNGDHPVYRGYWERYDKHFIEEGF